ncbi:hypothetical protein V6N11_077707 [Hibiscus sabdariffa]|uniref:Uncharacterized protein n=1 Tax=Hibiscus sabdariffa TaxID=183260 RepID=A0ABR2TDY3_9ROSI
MSKHEGQPNCTSLFNSVLVSLTFLQIIMMFWCTVKINHGFGLDRYIPPEQVPIQQGGLSVDYCDSSQELLWLHVQIVFTLPSNTILSNFSSNNWQANTAKKNHAAKNNIQDGSTPQQSDYYEEEQLVQVLKSIQGIASARVLAGNSLPEKVWLKQPFAIGVNDVTRVLERMSAITDEGSTAQSPCVRLQVAFEV